MVSGRYDIHGVTKQHITGKWHHVVGFMVDLVDISMGTWGYKQTYN